MPVVRLHRTRRESLACETFFLMFSIRFAVNIARSTSAISFCLKEWVMWKWDRKK